MNLVLSELSRLRPAFHSEADFQHALAWEIQQQYQNCSMRLEYKPHHLSERIYLDIWCTHEDSIMAIELKYKTRRLYENIKEETFELLDQSAQDIGRYDFLRDIQRLERIVFNRNDIVGYAIFLTNDIAYWNIPRNSKTVDASFRIHQGRILAGKLSWGSHASEGTIRGREEIIHIKRVYNLHWQDYSEPSRESYGKFKYLLVKIESRQDE